MKLSDAVFQYDGSTLVLPAGEVRRLQEIERALREVQREPVEKSMPPPGAHGVYR